MFGNKFTPENLQNSVLNAIHPSVRARVASSSGLQFGATFHVFLRIWLPPHSPFLAHYRPYNDEGANILTGDGKWPGSTPDDHVMFKSTIQLSHPTFSEGSHYKILSSTGKAWSLLSGIDPGRDLYLYDLFGHQVHRNSPTISVRITSDYLVNYSISVGCIVFPQATKWWWHCVALRAFRKMGRAEFLCSSDRI